MKKILGMALLAVLLPFAAAAQTITIDIAAAEKTECSKLNRKLDNIIADVVANRMTLQNSQPDKFLTGKLLEVDKIGQRAMQMSETIEALTLREKILALMTALRERRTFRYMLWAEWRLETAENKPYDNLAAVSEADKVKLYNMLSDINVDLIPENILSREIISRQAAVYDSLNPQSKRYVRLLSIQKQSGPLPNGTNIRPRRTLDEF